MLKELTILLSDVSDYVILVVALVAFFRRNVSSFFYLLFLYCTVIGSLQLTTTILAENHISNWFVYQILGLTELVFVFYLYRKMGLRLSVSTILVPMLIIYFADVVWVIYSDYHSLMENPNTPVYFVNNLGLSLVMLYTIVLGFLFLWRTYLKGDVEDIGKYPYFYISAGFSCYAAGAFFFYLLSSRLVPRIDSPTLFYYSWIVVTFFIYLKSILLLVGLKFAKDVE